MVDWYCCSTNNIRLIINVDTQLEYLINIGDTLTSCPTRLLYILHNIHNRAIKHSNVLRISRLYAFSVAKAKLWFWQSFLSKTSSAFDCTEIGLQLGAGRSVVSWIAEKCRWLPPSTWSWSQSEFIVTAPNLLQGMQIAVCAQKCQKSRRPPRVFHNLRISGRAPFAWTLLQMCGGIFSQSTATWGGSGNLLSLYW